MNKFFLYCCIFIFGVSTPCFSQISSRNLSEKKKKTLDKFIEGYNEQNYSMVKKSFSLAAKILVTKKMLMEQLLTPYYKRYGKIIRTGTPTYPAANTITFPLIYEKDTTEVDYANITFTKNNKIIGVYYLPDNIIYPKSNDSITIDDIVNPYLSFKHHSNTGLIIGTYVDGNKQVFSYGATETSDQMKPTDSTLFQIGSITKVLTSILLANSINNNFVDSISLLSEFLPDSIPKLSYKGREINLLNLAMHTSALPREPSNLDSTFTDERNPFANYQESDLMSYLKDEKLKRKTGKKYSYSNTGMGLLGYILAKQRKTTYEELLIKEICKKLEMKDTRINLSEEQKRRTVKSYYQGKETPDFTFTSTFVGAGSVYSSVNDMFKFIEANLHPEKITIEKDLLLAQRSRKINKHLSMGLAWNFTKVTTNKGIITVLEHAGNTMGSSSILILSKEENIGVIVFANSNVPVDNIGFLVFKLIVNEITNQKS